MSPNKRNGYFNTERSTQSKQTKKDVPGIRIGNTRSANSHLTAISAVGPMMFIIWATEAGKETGACARNGGPMKRTRILHHMVLSAVAMIFASTSISAQESSAIEEIVVTAQKREESLQTVPLAISAFTGDYLERRNIQTVEDLEQLVPGFNYDQYSPGQPRYYIRGVGNNLQSGSVEESVGIFVDGVYLERPAMTNVEFLNLERVEVLRGPQGTLFGRNVVGGAISYITKKPTEEQESGLSVTLGNYKNLGLKGYVSGPLSESMFASIAGTTSNHDGYAFNTTTQNYVYDKQYTALRGALRWMPSGDLDIQLIADVARNRGTGGWWILIEPGAQPAPTWLQSPWYNNNISDDGVNDVDNSGVTLHLDWNNDFGVLTSITSFRESFFHSRVHLTPPNVPDTLDPALVVGNLSNILFQRDFTEDAKQYSQEVRLASHAEGALNWVAGIYFHHTETVFRHDINHKFIFPFFQREGSSGSLNDSSTDAFAVFANVTYDISDALRFQIGARWSRDEKENVTTTYGVPTSGNYTLDGQDLPPGVGYTVSDKKSWDAFTPMVSLNYQATPDIFLYTTVSRGFKSGGFAGGQSDSVTAKTPFDPEFAWNYELGVKAEWFDRIRLNVAAYWMDYDNLQVRGLIPPVPPDVTSTRLFINAGETTVKGIETEFNVAASDNWSFYVSHAYTNSRIEKTEGIASEVLHVGDELIKTPDHKLYFGVNYYASLTDNVSATARATYAYTGSHYPQLPNLDTELIPSQDTIDASLTFEQNDGQWSLEVWGKNLTDEVILNSITTVQSSTYGFLDPPRTYGVTIRYRNTN